MMVLSSLKMIPGAALLACILLPPPLWNALFARVQGRLPFAFRTSLLCDIRGLEMWQLKQKKRSVPKYFSGSLVFWNQDFSCPFASFWKSRLKCHSLWDIWLMTQLHSATNPTLQCWVSSREGLVPLVWLDCGFELTTFQCRGGHSFSFFSVCVVAQLNIAVLFWKITHRSPYEMYLSKTFLIHLHKSSSDIRSQNCQGVL